MLWRYPIMAMLKIPSFEASALVSRIAKLRYEIDVLSSAIRKPEADISEKLFYRVL